MIAKGEMKKDIKLSDRLAIDRTNLANQRTLLAMLRTGLYLIIMGLTITSLNILEELKYLAFILEILGVITMAVGLILWNKQRNKILELYEDD